MTQERSVSTAVMTELERPSSPDALIAFLTIRHPEIEGPLRFVADAFDYVLDSETYSAAGFDGGIVQDDDQMPSAQLRVPNVDRRIGLALERSSKRAIVDLAIHSTADFDLTADPRTEVGTSTPVYAFERYELADVQCGPVEIVGRLTQPDYTTEPWTFLRATQERCPGLYV